MSDTKHLMLAFTTDADPTSEAWDEQAAYLTEALDLWVNDPDQRYTLQHVVPFKPGVVLFVLVSVPDTQEANDE